MMSPSPHFRLSLGAILMNNRALERVSEFLRPEHFADPTHGRIYQTLCSMIDSGRLASPVTAKPLLAGDVGLAELGGDVYLARLAASAATSINAGDYGRIIHDLAQRRELIGIGEDLMAAAYDTTEGTATEIQESIESELFKLSGEGVQVGGPVAFSTALDAVATIADTIHKADGKLRGLSTGLADLDKKLGGLHPTDLVILAGRPSMGKTGLATNIAFSAAKTGKSVLFDSLEMSREQLTQRIVCSETGIRGQVFLGERMTDAEADAIMDASRALRSTPLHIDDTPALTLAAIRTRARRLARQHGLDLIVIDYIQLIGSTGPSYGRRNPENRTQELSEITRGLKELAKELDVPVLALSQLSRAVEQREDKRPQLSDLRESGSIEQDADVVMFVYREQYYLERAEPKPGPKHDAWEADLQACANTAELIVAKHRNGPVGTTKLHFQPETTTFGNLDLQGE